MLSFQQIINEQIQLVEKLITGGGKAYPNFGNVVIMAGGDDSGKGFIKDKLSGVEGWTFDVDELTRLAVRTPKIIEKVKDELGFDLSELNPQENKDILKNPDNVLKLHEIIGDSLNLDDKRKKILYTSFLTAPPERKPNIIFDVSLKDMIKLQNLTYKVKEIGYLNHNIHIVWVVNQIEIAKKQNAERSQTVPVEVLVNTHRLVSQTMRNIIDLGNDLDKYMDGDIVIAFSQVDFDNKLTKSEFGGEKLDQENYFYIKRAGKNVMPLENINKDLRKKIDQYVPDNIEWM